MTSNSQAVQIPWIHQQKESHLSDQALDHIPPLLEGASHGLQQAGTKFDQRLDAIEVRAVSTMTHAGSSG